MFYTSKNFAAEDLTSADDAKESSESCAASQFSSNITDIALLAMLKKLKPLKKRKIGCSDTDTVSFDAKAGGPTHSRDKSEPNRKRGKYKAARKDTRLDSANEHTQRVVAQCYYDEKVADWTAFLVKLYSSKKDKASEKQQLEGLDFSKYEVISEMATESLTYEELKEGLDRAYTLMGLIRQEPWNYSVRDKRIKSQINFMLRVYKEKCKDFPELLGKKQLKESPAEQLYSIRESKIETLKKQILASMTKAQNKFEGIVKLKNLFMEDVDAMQKRQAKISELEEEIDSLEADMNDKRMVNVAEEKNIQDQIIEKRRENKKINGSIGGRYKTFYYNVAYIHVTLEIVAKKQELINKLEAQNCQQDASIASQPLSGNVG